MKKVLFIDDSEASLQLFKSIFTDNPNIDVVIESDSRKALPLIREEMPDAIVLDLIMPYVDGFQILKQIRNDPGISHIPVMILTARQDTETKLRVTEIGADVYIKKPIDIKDVEYRLRSMLYAQKKIFIG